MTTPLMIKPEAGDVPPASLDRKTGIKLRQLMQRDGLGWTEFLRRAVAAYDLMYSRSK